MSDLIKPVTSPNTLKKVWLGKHLAITADCIGLYLPGEEEKEHPDHVAFANSLPQAICFEGVIGLRSAYNEWLKENKKRKTK